jgi:hypothetical protein
MLIQQRHHALAQRRGMAGLRPAKSKWCAKWQYQRYRFAMVPHRRWHGSRPHHKLDGIGRLSRTDYSVRARQSGECEPHRCFQCRKGLIQRSKHSRDNDHPGKFAAPSISVPTLPTPRIVRHRGGANALMQARRPGRAASQAVTRSSQLPAPLRVRLTPARLHKAGCSGKSSYLNRRRGPPVMTQAERSRGRAQRLPQRPPT